MADAEFVEALISKGACTCNSVLAKAPKYVGLALKLSLKLYFTYAMMLRSIVATLTSASEHDAGNAGFGGASAALLEAAGLSHGVAGNTFTSVLGRFASGALAAARSAFFPMPGMTWSWPRWEAGALRSTVSQLASGAGQIAIAAR